MFCIRWDNKLNNKFNRPTKHHHFHHRRTTDNECNESKSCYFLVSVFIAPICKCFFVYEFLPSSASSFAFSASLEFRKACPKVKWIFHLRSFVEQNKIIKWVRNAKAKKRAETSNEQRKRFVKYFYKLKRYENNGVIYCTWELISVTRASCAPFAALEYVCNNCQIFFSGPIKFFGHFFPRTDTRKINSHSDYLNIVESCNGLEHGTFLFFSRGKSLCQTPNSRSYMNERTIFISHWLIAMYQTHRRLSFHRLQSHHSASYTSTFIAGVSCIEHDIGFIAKWMLRSFAMLFGEGIDNNNEI